MANRDVVWRIVNASNNYITGATPTMKVLRVADGYLLDWDDLTFKNAGWVTQDGVMTEPDATNLPGRYIRTVDPAGWDDGDYEFFTDYTGAINIRGTQGVRIKDGKFMDQVVASLFDEAFGIWEVNSGTNQLIIKDKNANVIATFDLTEGDAPAYVTRTPV